MPVSTRRSAAAAAAVQTNGSANANDTANGVATSSGMANGHTENGHVTIAPAKTAVGYASLKPLDNDKVKNASWTHSSSALIPGAIMVLSSAFIVYMWAACSDQYKCDIAAPAIDLFYRRWDKFSFVHLRDFFRPEGFFAYMGFMAVQGFLWAILPGSIVRGQTTPGGNNWEYKMNGLPALIVSIFLYWLTGFHLKLFDPAVWYHYLPSGLTAAIVTGYLITGFCYIKARVAPSIGPSGLGDVHFTDSVVADLFKGVELNPRIGRTFDIKLFWIGRVGMIGWLFVDLAWALGQYEKHGLVSNSMIAIIAMHLVYIADLEWREEWYLSTIDIMYDRGGYWLLWGVSVWIHFMYTLQPWYLIHNPVHLSTPALAAIIATHVIGYILFLDINTQRTNFRRDFARLPADQVRVGYLGGFLFPAKPKYVTAKWVAEDGKVRTSQLLVSGYWGWARHFNYVADLLMCFAWGCTSGTVFGAFAPYFYFFFMFVVLIHRGIRDERRLALKYGKDYEQYCKLVPWKVLPGVW